jgi:hypothetical protein
MNKIKYVKISQIEYNSLLQDSLELRLIHTLQTSDRYIKEMHIQKHQRRKKLNVKQTAKESR